MCGIYGVVASGKSSFNSSKVKKMVYNLAHTAGYRGYDSSGAVIFLPKKNKYLVYKGNIPIHQLYQVPTLIADLEESLSDLQSNFDFKLIGHARLATDGSQLSQENNQPVLRNNIAVVHNGIITNYKEIEKTLYNFQKESNLDTEVIPTYLSQQIDSHKTLAESLQGFFTAIEGTAAFAASFGFSDDILLACNFASLFIAEADGIAMFASERYFLEKVEKEHKLQLKITALGSGQYAIIKGDGRVSVARYSEVSNLQLSPKMQPADFEIKTLTAPEFTDIVVDPAIFQNELIDDRKKNLVKLPHERIAKLKRCTKCILPSTFPHIDFDEKGICNYCRNYVPKLKHQSKEKLKALLDSYRKKDGSVPCIVPFSGGRDSTYLIHILVKEFGVKPITYTYDWGMVTDLARRNIARVCGKLGLENIIVSADLREKRKFIRANILAWLKQPELGMIPIFMSGDKSFYYYLHKVKQHTGVSFNLWGENFLEKTDFKVGFAGVKPEFEKKNIYSLSKSNMAVLGKYLFMRVLTNPNYLNSSLLDNLKGQYSRSFLKKTDYFNFYDFHPWIEEEVESVIQQNYNWEKAIDTNSTWRIGDGTSAFYNYIYYTVAGFSEFDTFRSNQIREGAITREQALEHIATDNEVRYATLRWYLHILGLDFESVISQINAIPKLYK